MSEPARNRDLRRFVRRTSRARRRGGRGRGPVPVQRFARGVVGTATDTAQTARDVGAAAVSGNRPFVLGLLALVVVGLLMLAAPLQSWLDGRGRVDNLERQLTALERANTRLEERADRLHDPETVELLAREELGLIEPGEVAYVVVPPEPDRPVIAPRTEPEPAPAPWYERWWQGVTGLLP